MAQVFHKKFGLGTVIAKDEKTAVIRFNHGIEECPIGELEERLTVQEKIAENRFEDFDFCQLKTQAALIESINDSWGVFSKSNVDLLPHQLWVCNKVIQKWPFHFLIADDVGLGKTVEAGLVLWPLLSSGRVKRLLILTPAPLVEQWQERMNKMFDIRLERYSKEQDTDKSDFWNGHPYVVASMPTLTQVPEELRKKRQQRMFEADGWDLLVVDEAHHMNAYDKQGKTLGFQLVEKLENYGKIASCLFFTGTPHRGKDYGFWALMRLVNPDVFSEDKANAEQYRELKNYFIRNNKQCVTNMKGEKLFKPLNQRPMTFTYSPEEAEFYDRMSEFIAEGNAYATGLDGSSRQTVILVLIALQKIASSSICAIKSALKNRLAKFQDAIKKLEDKNKMLIGEEKTFQNKNDEGEIMPDETDSQSEDETERKILDIIKKALNDEEFKLMENIEDEIEHLEELIALADNVKEETRINKIVELIESDYEGEQVLLFTEYKRTQALMIGKLMEKFGKGCVGFINGDEALPDLVFNGTQFKMQQRRGISADEFNNGKIRFLVSTEAAGEGIDLQKNCHVLIHVDLPWNPMRLHQRVGRLNRYGQTKSVDVVSFRNPDTVESRIWGKLQEKLVSIGRMFDAGMDDPEDIMQLVLGMQRPEWIDELYSEGERFAKNKDNLDEWFDAKTQTLGGENAVSTIKNILGNAAKFNLAGLKDVPKLDLPDLVPFFKKAVKLAGRRISSEDDVRFSFKTPDGWNDEIGIMSSYDNLIFKRNVTTDKDAENICGVGHKIFGKALAFAKSKKETVCSIEGATSYFVYRVFDKITYSKGAIYNKFVIVSQNCENELDKISEEAFFNLLKELREGKSESAETLDFSKIEEYVRKVVADSDEIEFREPDIELFAAFLGNSAQ